MGAVNTTYTFTPTDVITSSKMNDIIDQTTMTSTAISGSTLQVTTSGQLAVSAQGITSNELAAASVTQAKIGANIAGTGPAFTLYSSTGTAVPTSSVTKINLQTEEYDTNNNCTNSRFTPTIAGFYFFSGIVSTPTVAQALIARIIVNGNPAVGGVAGSIVNAGTFVSTVSGMFFMNGSTDFVELFCDHAQGGPVSISGRLSGFLARAA